MSGELHIVTGPMFSGKTTEMIRRLNKIKVLNRKRLWINHQCDTRNDPGAQSIESHNHLRIRDCPVVALSSLNDAFLHPLYRESQVLFIDEAQFYSNLAESVLKMVERDHKHVVLAGLICKADRSPFGELTQLIPFADSVNMLSAFCSRCSTHRPGIFTRKKMDTEQTIGGAELYETLCRHHYIVLRDAS